MHQSSCVKLESMPVREIYFRVSPPIHVSKRIFFTYGFSFARSKWLGSVTAIGDSSIFSLFDVRKYIGSTLNSNLRRHYMIVGYFAIKK